MFGSTKNADTLANEMNESLTPKVDKSSKIQEANDLIINAAEILDDIHSLTKSDKAKAMASALFDISKRKE